MRFQTQTGLLCIEPALQRTEIAVQQSLRSEKRFDCGNAEPQHEQIAPPI
jgi:hypothetical protein